jgi:phosphocarrier protein HPr
MLERRVHVINELGLHARAAAKLVRVAQGFTSNITLGRQDKPVKADAKSILAILHLAACSGLEVTITADGDDEDAAMDAIEQMFVEGFGEISEPPVAEGVL